MLFDASKVYVPILFIEGELGVGFISIVTGSEYGEKHPLVPCTLTVKLPDSRGRIAVPKSPEFQKAGRFEVAVSRNESVSQKVVRPEAMIDTLAGRGKALIATFSDGSEVQPNSFCVCKR